MTLYIDLRDQILTLELKLNRKLIDSLSAEVNRDLDVKLIDGLDKLFKRNRLIKLSLKDVKTSRNIEKKSSNHKIITAFIKGLLST